MSFFEVMQLYMQDMLRQLSVWALWPVLLLLIIGAIYALWCIVSVIIEYFMQRRHFRENVPVFVDKIEACSIEEVAPIIEDSGMLVSQKDAMLQVAKRMNMEPADLFAVANRELGLCKEEHARVLGRTEIAAKVAPMVGLMGTLIPLGPGIVAMGQGNTEVLSASLLVAFDTTIAGLIIAGIAIVVSKVRKGWYTKYHAALEACMTALLQKAQAHRESLEDTQATSEIAVVEEPKAIVEKIDPTTSGLDVMVTDPEVEARRGRTSFFSPKAIRGRSGRDDGSGRKEATQAESQGEEKRRSRYDWRRTAGKIPQVPAMPSSSTESPAQASPSDGLGEHVFSERYQERQKSILKEVERRESAGLLRAHQEAAVSDDSRREPELDLHDDTAGPTSLEDRRRAFELDARVEAEELPATERESLLEEAEQIVAESAANLDEATVVPNEAVIEEAAEATSNAQETVTDVEEPTTIEDAATPEEKPATQQPSATPTDGSISLDALLSAIGGGDR